MHAAVSPSSSLPLEWPGKDSCDTLFAGGSISCCDSSLKRLPLGCMLYIYLCDVIALVTSVLPCPGPHFEADLKGCIRGFAAWWGVR